MAQEPLRRYAVVLSDVHIGNGAPTCWYQAPVHERRLTEILAWILARRQAIREVVLLGDVFDVWTYAPSQRPPSMADIIAANRTLLGPSGPLAALVRALPGEVRMLLGNHDGSLTRADVDTLNRSLGGDPARGERIELIGGPWRVVTGASGARTVFTHGHHWCMFNAPDARSRWATIPVGHFVSRAIGYQLARSLRPGETTADRRNSGNPSGVDLLAMLASWNRRDDLAAFLLSYICRVTGMPQTEPVVMPDGSTTTVREAMRVFDGLFTKWVRREGRALDAMRAAAADWRGEDLAWFAQRLALQTASDLTVMGHTHVPVGGLAVSPADYVNSGYECVARPDSPRKEFTFTQVDLEQATAQVLAVTATGGGLTVRPARAPTMPSVVRRPWMDYSCYARIENRSDRPLRLVRASKDADSYWVVAPPALIQARSRADVWVQDSIGLKGSSGRFTYTDGTRTLEFVLACPTGVARNVVRSPVPGFRTRTGSGAWRTGGVDWFGHPVQARFAVEAARTALVPATARPGGAAAEMELAQPAGGRIGARILWPALGFPAVVAPRQAPQGPPGAQHTICVLLLSDRPTLTPQDAARHLRIVRWQDRANRQAGRGFNASELTVRSGAVLERGQADDQGQAVVFGGDRHERCVAASLSRAVRRFYADQGLRHLHEIRVSEAATGRLPDDQYHLFWAGTTSGPSDEMRMLVDRFARPRRAPQAARYGLDFLLDEYRCDYGALHPPYQSRDPQRRLTEVLHPVFVDRRPGSLRIAHLTDTHFDVRNDVYEHNLLHAGRPMSVVGNQLRYERMPLQFNNWNSSAAALYEDAKQNSDAILLTGDLIDYGRGHIGLVNGGRHRHELGVDSAYHSDRNWFLFYYLLASGPRYRRPVYTILGNHDWRLNPYGPFVIKGAPEPLAFVNNPWDFTSTQLEHILRIAHGPGHETKLTYADLTVRRAMEAALRYARGNLDMPGSPLQTNVESVIWYLLLINPFLDFAFPHPRGQQMLMLDWGEDEEIVNVAKPGGPRALKSLTPLQRWHVEQFVRAPGRAKLLGIHAPVLGPYPEWKDEALRVGTQVNPRGRHMYQPYGPGRLIERHTITAIRRANDPYGISAEYGTIVRHRDWLIRELGRADSGVRLVFAGHNHRNNLLVAHPVPRERDARLMKAVSPDEVRGARNNIAAVRRAGGAVTYFPGPLYVNTTSAGPRGNEYAAQTRSLQPGWALVTLAGDGTIESVSSRRLGVPRPVQAPPAREVARFLQPSGV